MTKTLNEHRQTLKKHKDFETDIKRCKKSIISHLMACGYYNLPDSILEQFVDLIFTAQQKKPFFYSENKEEKPADWNSPKDWDKNYYRYEWGHLNSKNQNGFEANNVENLALLSARGNQHIQSSLDINEVIEIFEGSQIQKTASKNLERRRKLFSSLEWATLMLEMKKYWAPTEGKNTNNSEVIKHYTSNSSARSGALHTNKNVLYSYNRIISYVAANDNKCIYIYNYTAKTIDGIAGQKSSKTTSTHVCQLIRYCQEHNIRYKIIPGIQKETFKRERGTSSK